MISPKHLLISILAARYIRNDIPIDHPSLLNRNPRRNLPPSAQKVSDLLFRISFRDRGSRKRTSVMFMTFGQFMDHDFAYVIHGPTSLCPNS